MIIGTSVLKHVYIDLKASTSRCRAFWVQIAFLFIVVLLPATVRAEPQYFILSGFGPNAQRYPSAAAACEGYREFIQAGNDPVNPGGTSVVTYVSSEDTGFELRSAGLCKIIWSRTVNGQTSHVPYDWNYYSGGCRPGRQPKPNPPYFFSEPDGCIDSPVGAPEHERGNICKAGETAGQPILPSNAEKYRSEVDLIDTGVAPLLFARTYRSTWGLDGTRPVSNMGKSWTHSYEISLKSEPATNPAAISIVSPEGYIRTFIQSPNSAVWTATNSADTLQPTASGGWSYRRADADNTLTFDASGKLASESARNGWIRTYAYNAAGQLASISNGLGRSLILAYNASGRLATVTAPDARVIGYAYDSAGRLSTVTYPDGKTRSFVYENTAFPQALTGIIDESGVRWGTFSYDTQGRAISTELSGGVNRYQVSYPAAGSATVIDPLNTNRSFSYSTTKGKLAVTSGSLPSAGHLVGCPQALIQKIRIVALPVFSSQAFRCHRFPNTACLGRCGMVARRSLPRQATSSCRWPRARGSHPMQETQMMNTVGIQKARGRVLRTSMKRVTRGGLGTRAAREKMQG